MGDALQVFTKVHTFTAIGNAYMIELNSPSHPVIYRKRCGIVSTFVVDLKNINIMCVTLQQDECTENEK